MVLKKLKGKKGGVIKKNPKSGAKGGRRKFHKGVLGKS